MSEEEDEEEEEHLPKGHRTVIFQRDIIFVKKKTTEKTTFVCKERERELQQEYDVEQHSTLIARSLNERGVV